MIKNLMINGKNKIKKNFQISRSVNYFVERNEKLCERKSEYKIFIRAGNSSCLIGFCYNKTLKSAQKRLKQDLCPKRFISDAKLIFKHNTIKQKLNADQLKCVLLFVSMHKIPK
jgi:hypothetical protein